MLTFFSIIPRLFNTVLYRSILHFTVLNRWLSLWFGVYPMLSSHFARAFHELQCIFRVICCSEIWKQVACALGRFRERNGNWTTFLSSQIELNLSSIFCIWNLKSPISDRLYIVILFCEEIFQPLNTFRKENDNDYKLLLQ